VEYRAEIAALIGIITTALLFSLILQATQIHLPVKQIEVYKGFTIYMLDGYNDPYYIAQSPEGLCEVYINLGDLKADLDEEG